MFTGDVEADFTGPDVATRPDLGPQPDVGMPGTPPGVSGWDMKDLRLTYDKVNDTMYVGINTFTILGDADGDGDPSASSTYLTLLGGTDVPNLGETENAAVYFDLNQDGTWDVIAGVSSATDYSGFSVNVFTYLPNPPYFSPGKNFGTALPDNTGSKSPNPDATHPDLEFTIKNWSTLPGHDASPSFKVGAHLGSEQDAGIGEDFLDTSFSPSIDVEKLVSKDNVNFFDADNAASALYVNAGDSVYFKYIVTNTGNVTLTNITLSDDRHNVSSITKTDPLAPLASFNGTIGPITALLGLQTDVATATGDWGGFTLQNTDPANYFGSGPLIDVEKLVSKDNVNFFDADNAASALDVNAGNSVYFKYIVTNTGNVTLSNITLSDSVHNVTGITKTDPLAPLASFNGTIGPITALSGLQTDVATATGDWGGSTVQDTDSANYFGSGPSIDVEKLVSKDNVNFFDTDNAVEALHVKTGDSIHFKYIVTNTGNVALTNITLSDNLHNVSGITRTDPLVPLASFQGVIGPITALSGLRTDVANATGDWGGITVQDSDSANYLGGAPLIDVEKLVSKDNVNFFDADNATSALYANAGGTVYFKYIVTNTGNVTLTNITLSDNMHNVSGIAKIDPLAPLASFTGTIGPITALSELQTDVATAAGSWDGYTVQDTDPANYLGFVNCIHIEKSTNGDDADSPTGPYIPIGGAVTWVYNITNCGSLNLTNIVVADDNGTPLNLADDWPPAYISGDTGQPGVLEPYSQTHEAWIYQASGNATAGYYANIGYVSGTTQAGDAAGTASDPSHYYNRPTTVGWETYPVNKVRVLLPWVTLFAAIIAGASLLVLRRRRPS
jgi:hypothetical protein